MCCFPPGKYPSGEAEVVGSAYDRIATNRVPLVGKSGQGKQRLCIFFKIVIFFPLYFWKSESDGDPVGDSLARKWITELKMNAS